MNDGEGLRAEAVSRGRGGPSFLFVEKACDFARSDSQSRVDHVPRRPPRPATGSRLPVCPRRRPGHAGVAKAGGTNKRSRHRRRVISRGVRKRRWQAKPRPRARPMVRHISRREELQSLKTNEGGSKPYLADFLTILVGPAILCVGHGDGLGDCDDDIAANVSLSGW